MADDTAVQKLVEKLAEFYIEGTPVEEDLTCSLSKEFLQNIQDVLHTKQYVALYRWKKHFNMCRCKMLSNPEMFLRYVIYACREEARINLNIFERFLELLALLLHLRVVIYVISAGNFFKFIPAIFMAIYENELKHPFLRCGGFYRLVEFVNPTYVASKCIAKHLPAHFNPSAFDAATFRDLEKQIEILAKEKKLPKDFRFEEAETDYPSMILARKILETTQIELPPVSSDIDFSTKLRHFHQQTIGKLIEHQKIIKEQMTAFEADLEQCFNSDSENNDVVEQMTDDARYENIIEAVIRYNCAHSSGHTDQNNHLQKEAYGILENLKGKIKLFIELLDESDKE